jgi:hypothetical protein
MLLGLTTVFLVEGNPMRTASILFLVTTSLCLTPVAFGQRILSDTEVQGILDQLLSAPRSGWISAGTIQGTHYEENGPETTDSAVVNAKIAQALLEYHQENDAKTWPGVLAEDPRKLELDAIPFNVEYELTNRYTMTTDEIVKCDGQRFHWEVTVMDRSDSVALPSDLKTTDNYMARHYRMHEDWNQHRIFAYDGSEYTIYAASSAQATVDAANNLPAEVHGPLTAGLIPWGNGRFSGSSLSHAKVSAQEIDQDGALCIQMAIAYEDGVQTELLLWDSSKEYAVKAATFTTRRGQVVTYECSDYREYSGQWVPTTVAIKRENASPTKETWTDIRVLSTAAPSLSSFKVALALDATVQYLSPVTTSPLIYINSCEVDTDKLLLERLDAAAAGRVRPQNCATLALQHVASEFGKSLSAAAMTDLVGENRRTTLYDLKRAARNLGLYAGVVKTDLAGLKTLGTAKAILHLPGKSHLVVLDRVDDRYVWLIDLSNDRFYYRESVHQFATIWPVGTAMLVSNHPLAVGQPELPDVAAKEIAGGYWDCNILYQEMEFVWCDFIPQELCDGAFQYYHERYICSLLEGGTCVAGAYVQYQETPCIPDPIVDCTVTGMWRFYYMRACR